MEKNLRDEAGKENTGFVSQLRTTLESKNAETIFQAIKQIDMQLTGRYVGGGNERSTRSTIEEFLAELKDSEESSASIYLSDGGYSRLSIWWKRDNTIEIKPTYNSTDTVKAKWEQGK